jgi:hypothetical protein
MGNSCLFSWIVVAIILLQCMYIWVMVVVTVMINTSKTTSLSIFCFCLWINIHSCRLFMAQFWKKLLLLVFTTKSSCNAQTLDWVINLFQYLLCSKTCYNAKKKVYIRYIYHPRTLQLSMPWFQIVSEAVR